MNATGSWGSGSVVGRHYGIRNWRWHDTGNMLSKGIGLLFTDRRGGVSGAPYDSLNLAYHTGDNPHSVCENRAIVARKMGMDQGRFVFLEQVHGLSVARAFSRTEAKNEGDKPMELPQTDGVFTTEKGLVLAVLTADCVPMIIAFSSAGAVAVLHAGWKGTIGNIAALALKKMREELGVKQSEAMVMMGPAIDGCCYEVDEGRGHLFVERYGENSAVVSRGDGYHVDLFRANTINLVEAGVREDNIRRHGGCTCCDRRYFSYRREGKTGRQGTFVFLRG
jgi:polyphenol oxidase